MSIKDSLKMRRTRYSIGKNLPVSKEVIENEIKSIVELVPDAFNMKSSRLVVLFDEEHDKLWDGIYDVFEGKVPREKIDSFKNGAGTILYFYDSSIVKGVQDKFPAYADNFPVWANHANAMLQLSLWTALSEMKIGASLQHYNPVIDEKIKEMFNIPKEYTLISQMPFGGILEEPADKEPEEFGSRVRVIK